ncbi:MAG: leucine--tRNA ligase [Candidatus Gracilibacteria bacterium]|nr:leucine--tRNA ligase [Candidatus Gracilibacteria bacterium]
MSDTEKNSRYDHENIEQKWQDRWFSSNMFKADDDSKKEKYYVLDMFPYPSGSGLHVGHPEGYTATDIIARYMRMKGKNVLHPMGWDAFGLPAENYAIKTQVHPEESTLGNITTFKRQIKDLGFSYDWERELATCLPDYYRWTQWFFHFLYSKDLAYKKKAPVNWCDDCHTVLANEQVINGKCDRCKNEVHQKNLSQWFFKITDFLEDSEYEGRKTSGLLEGLDAIDWPESTKIGQRNWIGKQEGINITYEIEGSDEKIVVFTKYPETNFGANFVVVAPEHDIVSKITQPDHKEEVEAYVDRTAKMTPLERQENKEKTGAFTGSYALNPLNGLKMPIYLADFVMAGYGTGMVVAVPAHDERDFEFAQKYGIENIRVMITPDGDDSPVTDIKQVAHEGTMVNSQFLDGMDAQAEAKKAMMDYMEKEGMGERVIFFNMRDWLVSRQRYWGAPIPMVFDDQENEYLIPLDELPVELPKDVDFNPSGESPLTNSQTFHDELVLKRIEGKLKASGVMSEERSIVRRESDTMDTFVCSSWYQFRFMDPHNDTEFASKEMMKQWGPIDLYVGGAEHTVLHLLYSRFFTKVLHRYGFIDYDEPFTKLRHQGMILGEDGEKMSKSRGNVINPDTVVKGYGCDTLRLYEMFMGPFKDMKPWSMAGVQGVYRFLQKIWRLSTEAKITDAKADAETLKVTHQTLKKVTHDIEDFKFNTAISQMMIMVNHLQKLEEVPRESLEILLICLHPYAPHLTEEVWERLGHQEMIMTEEWPIYDDSLAKEDTIQMPVQVNGKVRGTMEVSPDISEKDALEMAKENENVQKYLEGKELVKELYVPGRIVNLVVKG